MGDRMTKWPVLLVHGLFYREDYWGRVPGVLRREGAVVLCPRHQSTARVAQSGGQLARLIRAAAGEGGKVNLIAHSKGGLDGPNDGLVAESSFPWGETYTLLTSEDGRGVSHEDVTDLWKREIPGVDVPGFYRGLVLGLGERGL